MERRSELKFIGVVNQKGKAYQVSDTGLENYLALRKRGGRELASSFSSDPEYIHTAEYYLFKRVAKTQAPA